jgi:hypothetical protein
VKDFLFKFVQTLMHMTLLIDVQLSLPPMFISTVCRLDSQAPANWPTTILTTSHHYDTMAMEPPKHSTTHDSDGIPNP